MPTTSTLKTDSSDGTVHDDGDDDDDAEANLAQRCALCLGPRKHVSAIECGHLFCWSCIQEWLAEAVCCRQCWGGRMLARHGPPPSAHAAPPAHLRVLPFSSPRMPVPCAGSAQAPGAWSASGTGSNADAFYLLFSYLLFSFLYNLQDCLPRLWGDNGVAMSPCACSPITRRRCKRVIRIAVVPHLFVPFFSFCQSRRLAVPLHQPCPFISRTPSSAAPSPVLPNAPRHAPRKGWRWGWRW